MKYKIEPNFILITIGLILGAALYDQFDFQNTKFENPTLAIIYFIAFVLSIGFMIKKSKNN